MSKTHLAEYEAVSAVARRGNFRADAVDLGMSPSALSPAVAKLETRLGVRLLTRTTRSVSFLGAGEQFVARIAQALSEIGARSNRSTATVTPQRVSCASTPRWVPLGRSCSQSFSSTSDVIRR
jgi:DNA-binding transcriptional LysR family regulator